jgi:FixJ family two-component response regulator
MTDKSIVIIDDQVEIRDTITELIDSYLSIRPISFESLDSFLEYLDSEDRNIDLVISDVHMPTGSGLRLNIEFENRGITTPIVFFSGMADQLPKSKNVTILRKPLIPDQFIQTIEELIK